MRLFSTLSAVIVLSIAACSNSASLGRNLHGDAGHGGDAGKQSDASSDVSGDAGESACPPGDQRVAALGKSCTGSHTCCLNGGDDPCCRAILACSFGTWQQLEVGPCESPDAGHASDAGHDASASSEADAGNACPAYGTIKIGDACNPAITNFCPLCPASATCCRAFAACQNQKWSSIEAGPCATDAGA